MVKKVKKDTGGVPDWVVTFGDMMSLLLCFFILLQMFSELKKEHEYQRVITAIKEAFGYAGGVGVLPIDDPPLKSMIETLEEIAMKTMKESKVSQNPIEGVEGPQVKVKSIREGMVFTIGGPSTFEELSAEVKPPVYAEIEKLAIMLAGRKNKIVVRGHAAAIYLPENAPFSSLDDLAYRRAMNVKNVLVELGIDEQVFRIEVVGTREPVRARAANPNEAAENRRVEIILTEQLVEEVNTDANHTSEALARGE